jgi:hypothetical protein
VDAEMAAFLDRQMRRVQRQLRTCDARLAAKRKALVHEVDWEADRTIAGIVHGAHGGAYKPSGGDAA